MRFKSMFFGKDYRDIFEFHLRLCMLMAEASAAKSSIQ
jgi:hypothetical protein